MTDTQTPRRPTPDESAGTFRYAKTLFRVRGVPIRVDASWLLIAGLVLYVFATRMAALLADQGTAAVVLAAALASVLFFASLLAHELGHALASVDRGIPVLGITLFLMGGVTESTAEAKTARDEFVVVGIGPYISLVLAAAFGLLHVAVQDVELLAAVTGYLGWTNLALAVFNLLPGYPLDGGRLLRSLLWMGTGQPHRATRWAARVGQAFALGLVLLGALSFTRPGGLSGLWEVLIGLFLLRGASESHSRARLRERLTGRRVGDLMVPAPPALDQDQALSDAVVLLQERPAVLVPVLQDGATLRGVVHLSDLDAVPRQDWWARRVHEVMHRVDGPKPVSVPAAAALDTAVDALADSPLNQLIVTDDRGAPVGLLTASHVTDELM
jgi:Zn-dependent protease/CBS domain-containing protein